MPTLLTDTDLVKLRLGVSDDDDELLEQLITEVSADFEHRTSRVVAEATYTEYYSGRGEQVLHLRNGPLVSVTSVETVSWGKDSNGDPDETRTTVDPGDYRLDGLRSDRFRGAGKIKMLCGSWCPGTDNYRIVYVAGWDDDIYTAAVDDIPQDLVSVATSRVCELYNLRRLHGLTARDEGDGSQSTIPDANREAAWSRAVWSWRLGVV